MKHWPGFKFNIEVEGIDEYSNPTTTLARLQFISYNKTAGVCIIMAGVCIITIIMKGTKVLTPGAGR